MSDDDWLTYLCEICHSHITCLKQDYDGFNVCRVCRWFTERGIKPRHDNERRQD